MVGAEHSPYGLNCHKPLYNIAGARQVPHWPNARKCYGRMSNHMCTKHARNDTKAIQKRSKGIQFQTKTSKTSTVSSCLV